MIFDKIENHAQYLGISEKIDKALKTAAETDFTKLSDGRYDIDGDELFYMVQRYTTKPTQDIIEAHRKYIDLQLLATGNEKIGFDCTADLKSAIQYDNQNDVEFFAIGKNLSFAKMSSNCFAIFYPNDAHMPGCQIENPEEVIKVVFKIKV